MSFIERPDRIGRTFLLSTVIWGAVALGVFGVLHLVFPDRPLGYRESGTPCTPSVSFNAYDPTVTDDPVAPVLAAPSRCSAAGKGTNEALHAYLEGAELDSTPTQPSPKIDARLLARGAELYDRHCATCHGATGDGIGPDFCALAIPAAVHKSGVFALRTTEHEALPTDEDLFRTITRGVHGTAMPPWIALAEPDRWALVAHVKGLSKQFEEDTAPPSLDFGQPPAATSERLAAGQELYTKGGCASCHGATGHGDGPAAAAFAVKPRDFTSGRFHRGSSTYEIHQTLVTGLDGTPMGSFAKVMNADELWNVSLFVHQLAPPMADRNGVRCPEQPKSVSTQELFGIRNLMHTMKLESGS